jgi:hypothetical protein
MVSLLLLPITQYRNLVQQLENNSIVEFPYPLNYLKKQTEIQIRILHSYVEKLGA